MPEKETCRPAWRKSHFISNSNNIKRYKIYTFYLFIPEKETCRPAWRK